MISSSKLQARAVHEACAWNSFQYYQSEMWRSVADGVRLQDCGQKSQRKARHPSPSSSYVIIANAGRAFWDALEATFSSRWLLE